MSETFYVDIDGDKWQYELSTDPPQAMYWDTYKVKTKDIKIVTKCEPEVRRRLKGEILKDIKGNDDDK